VSAPRRIEQMYAWVTLDPADNTEGLIGAVAPDGRWAPFVGADERRIRSQRPSAQVIADEILRPVTLVRFELRHEIEVLEPQAISLVLGRHRRANHHP
jgi:hypothetical protein